MYIACIKRSPVTVLYPPELTYPRTRFPGESTDSILTNITSGKLVENQSYPDPILIVIPWGKETGRVKTVLLETVCKKDPGLLTKVSL